MSTMFTGYTDYRQSTLKDLLLKGYIYTPKGVVRDLLRPPRTIRKIQLLFNDYDCNIPALSNWLQNNLQK